MKTMVTAGLVLAVVVVLAVGHVAVRAYGLKVAGKYGDEVKRQRIENWELFFRQALQKLGEEISQQEDRMRKVRLARAKDRVVLKREERILEDYRRTVDEFARKVRESGNGEVKAHGKTYTPELAQDQLRVFVTAVVDQQEKVKGLQEGIEGKDEALGRLQQALFTARNRIAGLESKGAKLVEEKAVAELKATSMAISNAVAGLDPKAPLSGAMLEIRELIDAMQEHVDGQLAQADVATEMGHAGGELISANEAIGDGGYNGRHERIESQLQKALAGE